MTENFADTPMTITEARANRSEKGADWLPRDVLLKTLREIDQGEIKPEGLVVIWYERDEDGGATHTTLRQATKDELTMSGLILSALKIASP